MRNAIRDLKTIGLRLAAFLFTRIKNFHWRYFHTGVVILWRFFSVDCIAFYYLGIRQTMSLWWAVAVKERRELLLHLRGLPHGVILRPASEDYEVFRQVFLQRDYDLRLNFEPKVIVDGGANCGYSSLFFASRFPSSRVVAIEPEKNNYECLRRNTTAYANVTPVCAALWPHNTLVQEVSGTNKSWSFQFREMSTFHGPVDSQTEGMSITTVLQRVGLANADLIKLDVEGAERELFSENFEQWLPQVKTAIIELHERYAPGVTEIVSRRAKEFGFRIGHRGENVLLIKDGGSPSSTSGA